MTQPTVTGRGAWTHIGGTTPYYELTKPRLGAKAQNDPTVDTDWNDYRAVWAGVKAIKHRLIALGNTSMTADGVFGSGAKKGVTALQTQAGMQPDGKVGPTTSKYLFKGLIEEFAAAKKISAAYMHGIIQIESGYDPGAVGYYTPKDKGLAQFNTSDGNNTTWWTDYPQAYGPEQAFDAYWAIKELANRLAWAKKKFSGKTDALRRNCMIAQHNSPQWAQEWFDTGKAPNSQIQDYVTKVLAEAKTFVV